MEIKNRQQILAIVAILGLLALVGDKLILTPLVASWNARTDQIAELKKSISQGNLLLDREKTIRARWGGMRKNTLPNNASVAQSQVLKAFDRWAQDSHATIGSIKPQWKQNADDYTTLECRADASGNIQALSRFLYEVEKDPLALKIEAVEITAHDDNGQQLTLALQLSGLLLTPPNP